MIPTFVLLLLLLGQALTVAIPNNHGALFATVANGGGIPTITASPSVSATQYLPTITASISSLLNLLHPPVSIISELTAFPTSVLSDLQGPNVVSAFDAFYGDKGMAWFTALPSGAESWVLGLPAQAATILPQVISLQSLANAALYPVSPTSTFGSPATDLSPTATSSVMTATTAATATVSSNAKRGITMGQEIGAIVGAAVLITVCGTSGFFLYDVLNKKHIEKALRAAAEQRARDNPPRTYVPSRRSQQWSAGKSQGSRPSSQVSVAELGGGVRAARHQRGSSRSSRGSMEIRPAPPIEIYEMHSPAI